jgi:tetratricopeptide (TPR) repeat protein
MKTQTTNRAAFEEVTRALGEIDEYNTNKNFEHLERAEVALARAREEDADYLDAVFYSGMVCDLIGKPKDAIPYFERILKEADKRDTQIEARFNLAVSYYHRYSHRFLQVAEAHFLKVLDETEDARLQNMTRAHLGQTYAMWMIPNDNQKNAVQRDEKAAAFAHIEKMFNRSQDHVRLVRKEIPQRFDQLWIKIAATADNASGMAHMYLSDYPLSPQQDNDALLREAAKNLEAAEKRLPGDWANTSDLGSLHLRLGVMQKRKSKNPDEEFQQAKRFLEEVVTSLRPNYGFALYELGRLHRVWKKWDEAVDYFDRSLNVPEKYRDVGTERVKIELARAKSQDDRYLDYLPLSSDIPEEHRVA